MIEVDPSKLYEARLLIFFEEGPQAGKYRQLLLTYSQFKKVSQAISEVFPVVPAEELPELKPGIKVYDVELSDELYELPDVQSINNYEGI